MNNEEKYRAALEEIVSIGLDLHNYQDYSIAVSRIAKSALAPTPEQRGETPLFYEGTPV